MNLNVGDVVVDVLSEAFEFIQLGRSTINKIFLIKQQESRETHKFRLSAVGLNTCTLVLV